MAAVYQASLQTILTRSELNQMSYNDVKIRIGQILGMDETSSKNARDVTLLEEVYEGIILIWTFESFLQLEPKTLFLVIIFLLRDMSETNNNHNNHNNNVRKEKKKRNRSFARFLSFSRIPSKKI